MWCASSTTSAVRLARCAGGAARSSGTSAAKKRGRSCERDAEQVEHDRCLRVARSLSPPRRAAGAAACRPPPRPSRSGSRPRDRRRRTGSPCSASRSRSAVATVDLPLPEGPVTSSDAGHADRAPRGSPSARRPEHDVVARAGGSRPARGRRASSSSISSSTPSPWPPRVTMSAVSFSAGRALATATAHLASARAARGRSRRRRRRRRCGGDRPSASAPASSPLALLTPDGSTITAPLLKITCSSRPELADASSTVSRAAPRSRRSRGRPTAARRRARCSSRDERRRRRLGQRLLFARLRACTAARRSRPRRGRRGRAAGTRAAGRRARGRSPAAGGGRSRPRAPSACTIASDTTPSCAMVPSKSQHSAR